MNALAIGKARGFASIVVVLLAVLLLCAAACGAPVVGALNGPAPVFDATRLLAPTDLNTDWRIQAGDDPA